MLVYLARRMAVSIMIFFSVTALCFFLFYLQGGESIARQDAREDRPFALARVQGRHVVRPAQKLCPMLT